MTESGLARAEASTELSLWSKLGGPLRRSSVQTLSKTDHVRAKVIPTPELLLLSKLDRVTKLRPGRGATVGGNPEGCQGTKGDLHVEISSDSYHVLMETLAE